MRIIKKYKNRKLYDSVTRKFVKLKDIVNMFIEGEKIKVLNHLGEDITNDVISKAKLNNPMYIPIDKNYFKKVISSFENLLQGNYDEFAEVLFKLVEEKVIDAEYARTLAVKIINNLGEKHDVPESEIIEFLKDCGLVPTEKYDELKKENEKFKCELAKQSSNIELVKIFWNKLKNNDYDEFEKLLSEKIKINFLKSKKEFKKPKDYVEFIKENPIQNYVEVKEIYPCGEKVVSVTEVQKADTLEEIYNTAVFSFINNTINSIKFYNQ